MNDHLSEAARILRQTAAMLEEASNIDSVFLQRPAVDAAQDSAPKQIEVALGEIRRA